MFMNLSASHWGASSLDNNKQITTAGSSFNNSKREETSTESINRNQEPQSTNKRQVSKSTPISASPSANSVVSDERRMKMNKMTVRWNRFVHPPKKNRQSFQFSLHINLLSTAAMFHYFFRPRPTTFHRGPHPKRRKLQPSAEPSRWWGWTCWGTVN